MIILRRKSLRSVSYQEQLSVDQTVTTTRDERLATHPVRETLSSDPQLARFSELLQKTGLDRMVEDGEWITVLAPADTAFERRGSLPEGDELHQFVRRYISQGAKTTDDLRRAGSLRMKDGSEVPVRVEGTDIRIGNARIVRPDIECTNGVIQVIDALLE